MPHGASLILPGKSGNRENEMIGLLTMKPLLLLGGVGYLGYRIFYKPIKSHLDAHRNRESAGSAGIEMKRCPECHTFIRGDAIECPSCNGKVDHPLSPE